MSEAQMPLAGLRVVDFSLLVTVTVLQRVYFGRRITYEVS